MGCEKLNDTQEKAIQVINYSLLALLFVLGSVLLNMKVLQISKCDILNASNPNYVSNQNRLAYATLSSLIIVFTSIFFLFIAYNNYQQSCSLAKTGVTTGLQAAQITLLGNILAVFISLLRLYVVLQGQDLDIQTV